MPQISILSLLGYSGASTVFFITLGFAALSMTKVSPKSFQLARICFIATGVVPLAALIHAATQYQMANYWRIIVFLVGTTIIAVPIRYLLRLVNENEQAYAETVVVNIDIPVECGPNVKGGSKGQRIYILSCPGSSQRVMKNFRI